MVIVKCGDPITVENVWLAVAFDVSVTVTITLVKVPVVVGVPLTTPADVGDKPVGRPVMDHV